MMSAIADMISSTSVVDLVSMVWMEVTMACLAAVVWLTLTGTVVTKAPKKFGNDDRKTSPKQTTKSPKLPASDKAEQQTLLPIQEATKALRQDRLQDAISLLQDLPETLAGNVPASVAPRLLMAVAKAANFDEAVAQLTVLAGKVESRALEAVLLEAVKNKDLAAGRQLQVLAGPMLIPKSARTMEALVQLHASDVGALRNLVDEATAPLAKGFATAVLQACAALQEVDLAMDVFDKVAEVDAAALRAVAEKASQVGNSSRGDVENCNKHKRDQIAKDIRACGKAGDLKAALEMFYERSAKGAQSSSLILNAIIDACVQCGDVDKAAEFFSNAEANTLDTITYNIMIKGRLAQGDEAAAARLLAVMLEKGFGVSLAPYHGLLNARVNANDRTGAWKIVGDMQAAGVEPTNVTCWILLKIKAITATDLSRVLVLLESVNEPVDEAFFAAVVDVCVKANCLDMLSKYSAKFGSLSSASNANASTYGAMIKAYGQVADLKRIWGLWEEMTSAGVTPTAITLGCMVEALVMNGCTSDAWQLAQQLGDDEKTRALVNTVIYTTILKGFAWTQDMKMVTAVYDEMRAHDVQPNTITYNTILNAFAQSGTMDRVPALLEDMKSASPPVDLDIVTYSTIVKGFCNAGNLDRALEILQDMLSSSDLKFKPDEVLYNSLLDGCAKQQRPDDALKLLDDMRKSGVKPSNYTLSMIVKLMGRCRRVNKAFSLIEELSQEYKLKVNIQVYTCLAQACFNNKMATKAVSLYDQIMEEGLLPDEMTYTVFVKGCLQAGLVDQAVKLAKCAHGIGLSAKAAKATPPGIADRCLSELLHALGGAGSPQAKALQAEFGECKVKPVSKGKGKGGKGKA